MKILYVKNTPNTWGKKSTKAINTDINFSETTGLMRKKKKGVLRQKFEVTHNRMIIILLSDFPTVIPHSRRQWKCLFTVLW